MLRFLVCDMGNVLIRFDPELFFDRLEIYDPGDRELLLREIFRSPLWPQLDLGMLTEAELEEKVLPELPHRLHTAAHALIFEWDRPIQPVPGMASFLETCKRVGLGLYLLSNASVRQPEYWPRVPGSHLFDGGVVSAFCHMAKPSLEIYRYTLEKFHLPSEECLFVDDVGENVTAAAGVGMEGFLFTGDVAALRRKVRSFGIPLSPESDGEAL